MIDKYQYSFNFIGTMQWAIKYTSQGLFYEFIRNEGFNLAYGLIDTGKKIKEKERRKPEFNAEDYELPEESKIPDWEIGNEILKALNRIRKENPDNYINKEFNKGDGFCNVLRIAKNDFEKIIGYLEEKGLIRKDKSYIYITAEGIYEINREIYKYRIIDPITSDTQKLVHDRLNEINPNIFSALDGIKKQLIEEEKGLKWQQVAFECRDIIQDFTNSLYRPEYLPEGEKAPKKSETNETKRKLRFILQNRLNNSEKTERELLEGLIEYLYKYFDCLNELIQKGVHEDIEKSDAERCLIYTYLFIGDVLSLTKL